VTAVQVRVGLGIVRCVHALDPEDEDGLFPTAEDMTGDAVGIGQDADTLYWALFDWKPPRRYVEKSLTIEQGLPQGPQGGCGGWEWTATYKYQPCKGC
jgi:hypothetical protein